MNNGAVNIDEFEMAIRADERAKIMREIEMRRKARIEKKQRKAQMVKQYIIQRIFGLLLVVGSVIAVASGWTYDVCTQSKDGTILFITIPLGLYMIFTKELLNS